MTRLLLALNLATVLVEREGNLLIRERGKADRPPPFDPQLFYQSALTKYGWYRVLGSNGSSSPPIGDEEGFIPLLTESDLPSGEKVLVVADKT